MAVVFTYGGTVFTCTQDPAMGGYTIERKWMNPLAESSGGKKFYFNKEVVRDIATLSWINMDPTDLTNLLAFIDAVDGTSNSFKFIAPDGTSHTAFFWGPDRIEWTPVEIMEREFAIQLLIVCHEYLKTFSDSMALSDALSYLSGKNLADSVSLSDIERMAYGKALTDTVSLSDIELMSYGANKSDGVSLSENFQIYMAGKVGGYLTDDIGNYITDEDGNHITVAVAWEGYQLTDDLGNNITDESGHRLWAEAISL